MHFLGLDGFIEVLLKNNLVGMSNTNMANNEIKVSGKTFPPRSENNIYSANGAKIYIHY